MDQTTRQTLLRRLKVGDDRIAWDEFCKVYQPLVRAYVRRFHVQDHDADDLAQETFAKLRVQMPRFDLDHARGRFRGWLRLVTDNTVRDWLGSSARRHRAAQAPVDPNHLEVSFAGGDAADDRRRLEWRRAVLALVLEQVRGEYVGREKTFACFEMSILQNHPAKDVAAALGIEKVNNVHVYAHRVVQRVRALCDEYDEDLDEIPPPPAGPG